MREQLDISARVEARAEQRARAAELAARDREHGGLVPADRDRESAERAYRAWRRGYAPSASSAEIAAAKRGDPIQDFRTVSVARLQLDISRELRDARAYRDELADVIGVDALALLLRWPSHGSEPTTEHPNAERTDLGGELAARMAERHARHAARSASRSHGAPSGRAVLAAIDALERDAERMARAGTLPMRRAWLDAERQLVTYRQRVPVSYPAPTRGAKRAVRAAIQQSARAWEREAKRAPAPIGDALDVSAAIEAEQLSERRLLPDAIDAPETLARIGGIPLDAARAIVARAYRAPISALAYQWRVSANTASVAVSRGERWIRERYPDPRELLAWIDSLGALYRRDAESDAALALLAYRGGELSERDALERIERWQLCAHTLTDAERVTLASARRALQRAGRELDYPISYGSELAERVAEQSERVLTAATRAARRTRSPNATPARTLERWSAPDVRTATRGETRHARRWSYALAARSERAELAELASETPRARRRELAPSSSTPAPTRPMAGATLRAALELASAERATPRAVRLVKRGESWREQDIRAPRRATRLPERQRARKWAPAELALRAELRALLDAGSSNADRIRELRAELRELETPAPYARRRA